MHKTKLISVMLNSENCELLGTVPKYQLYIIFSTILFLNLDMFRFLSTYEINLELGYTYENDMLKFSRKSKTCTMLSWNFECYKSKF